MCVCLPPLVNCDANLHVPRELVTSNTSSSLYHTALKDAYQSHSPASFLSAECPATPAFTALQPMKEIILRRQ